MPYERPEFGVVQYEERQFIFAALERHWSWAVGFVGYPVPHFPQSFWQEPAPPMNHAPRTTDFDFSPKVARRRRRGDQWPSHSRGNTEASTPHECRGFLCENDVASASETPTTDLCGNQISGTPRHRRDAVIASARVWAIDSPSRIDSKLLFCPAEGSPSRFDEKPRDAVYGMPVSRISPVLWASRVLELHLRHANQSSGMAKELACTPRVNYCVW